MTGGATGAEDRFRALVDVLAAEPGVRPPTAAPGRGRTFGAATLTVDGRIFAMLQDGRLVVKLPRERVAGLVADGAGGPFRNGRGSAMREWVTVDAARHTTWEPLAREALAFVGKRA